MSSIIPLANAVVTVDKPRSLSQRVAATAVNARASQLQALRDRAHASVVAWKSDIEASLATAVDLFVPSTVYTALFSVDGTPFEFPAEDPSLAACGLVVMNVPATPQKDIAWAVKLMGDVMGKELADEGFTYLGCGYQGSQWVVAIASPELARARREELA